MAEEKIVGMTASALVLSLFTAPPQAPPDFEEWWATNYQRCTRTCTFHFYLADERFGPLPGGPLESDILDST
jgi:hypothetical protein